MTFAWNAQGDVVVRFSQDHRPNHRMREVTRPTWFQLLVRDHPEISAATLVNLIGMQEEGKIFAFGVFPARAESDVRGMVSSESSLVVQDEV